MMLNGDARRFIASIVPGSRRHCCTTRVVSRRKKCATSWPIGCEGGGARECASIHAVVPDVLYLLRVAWCALHALYRARAAYAAVTLPRSCMRWGMALGWGRVQEATCDVKRGRGGRGGSGSSMGSSSPQRVDDGRMPVVFSQLQGGFSFADNETYCKK